MPRYHIVKQGEHLSGIAKEYGFADYRKLWNDPANADLKRTRQNPHVLFPGDQLFIPEMGSKDVSCSTEKRHKFELQVPTLRLRLQLEDAYGEPVSDTECELVIEGKTIRVITDNQGRIEENIPRNARSAALVIRNADLPFGDVCIPIKIGHLDPVEEVSGQAARLNNLGYFIVDNGKEDKAAFHSAVEEFQCDRGLQVDGICGPITQTALKHAHGS